MLELKWPYSTGNQYLTEGMKMGFNRFYDLLMNEVLMKKSLSEVIGKDIIKYVVNKVEPTSMDSLLIYEGMITASCKNGEHKVDVSLQYVSSDRKAYMSLNYMGRSVKVEDTQYKF